MYDARRVERRRGGLRWEPPAHDRAPGDAGESYTTFLDKAGLRGARVGVFRDLFRKGPQHAEGVALVEKAIAQMKQAGAVIVDPVSTGTDLFPLLEETRTNYYEGQFSYDLYFRRLGPNPSSNLTTVARQP